MRFTYQIPIEEYVAGQSLYYKGSFGAKFIRNGVFWALAGFGFILIGILSPVFDWPSFLNIIVGAWWFYAGVARIFPKIHFRRYYKTSKLLGKTFEAEFHQDSFEVAAENCRWSVKRPAVSVHGEDERVFVMYAANTVFIFGKKYLSQSEQQQVRAFLG